MYPLVQVNSIIFIDGLRYQNFQSLSYNPNMDTILEAVGVNKYGVWSKVDVAAELSFVIEYSGTNK